MANRIVILSLSKDPLTSILSRQGRGRLRYAVFTGWGLRGIFSKEFLILLQRESIRE
jgi:hypothetical protein